MKKKFVKKNMINVYLYIYLLKVQIEDEIKSQLVFLLEEF
jgi:hypothetical protein